MIAAAIWNTSGGHQGQPVKPEEFFPSLVKPERTDPDSVKARQKALLAKIRAAFGAGRGAKE